MIQKFAALLIVVLSNFVVEGFNDGAPPDTCVKERFNQPNHGQYRSQPLETLPYQVVASSSAYQPGETISCKYVCFYFIEWFWYWIVLVTISGGAETFRGFFFQARDAKTQEWVGTFEDVSNTKSIPECASITHGDNRDKTQATLLWKAPEYRQGQVFFT